MSDLYISIAVTSFFVSALLVYLLRSALVGRVRHARTEADGGSVFVNKTTMEMVYWIIDPMISFIAALRITPNMVTLGSLIPAAGAEVTSAHLRKLPDHCRTCPVRIGTDCR